MPDTITSGRWITPSSAQHREVSMTTNHVTPPSPVPMGGGGGDIITMTLDHAVRVPCALRNAGRRTMYDVLHRAATTPSGEASLPTRSTLASAPSWNKQPSDLSMFMTSRAGTVNTATTTTTTTTTTTAAAALWTTPTSSVALADSEPDGHHRQVDFVSTDLRSAHTSHSVRASPYQKLRSSVKDHADNDAEGDASGNTKSGMPHEMDISATLSPCDKESIRLSESTAPAWCDISDFSSDADSNGRDTWEQLSSPTACAAQLCTTTPLPSQIAETQLGDDVQSTQTQQQRRKPGGRQLDELVEDTYSDEMLRRLQGQRHKQQERQAHRTVVHTPASHARELVRREQVMMRSDQARRTSPSPTQQHGVVSQAHTPLRTCSSNKNNNTSSNSKSRSSTHCGAEEGVDTNCNTSRSRTRSGSRLGGTRIEDDALHGSAQLGTCAAKRTEGVTTTTRAATRRAYGKPQGVVLHSLARREAFGVGHAYSLAYASSHSGVRYDSSWGAQPPRNSPSRVSTTCAAHEAVTPFPFVAATAASTAGDLIDRHNPHHRRLLRQLAKSNVTALCVLHHLRECFALWQLDELPTTETCAAAVALQLRVTAVMPASSFHLRGLMAEVRWASAGAQAKLNDCTNSYCCSYDSKGKSYVNSMVDVSNDMASTSDAMNKDDNNTDSSCEKDTTSAKQAVSTVWEESVECGRMRDTQTIDHESNMLCVPGTWLVLIPEHVISALCTSSSNTNNNNTHEANSRVVLHTSTLVGETLYLAEPLLVYPAAHIILPSYCVTSETMWRCPATRRSECNSDDTPVRWSWYGQSEPALSNATGATTSNTVSSKAVRKKRKSDDGDDSRDGNYIARFVTPDPLLSGEMDWKEEESNRAESVEDERGAGFPQGPGEEWGVPINVLARVRTTLSSSATPRCSGEATDQQKTDEEETVLWSSGEEVSPPVTPPVSDVHV